MVAHAPGERMNLPIAPLAAVVLGALAALGVAAMPVSGLESLVMDSGLPSVLPAAEPPLGLTARAVMALLTGGFVGLFTWLAGFILVGTRSVMLGKTPEASDEDVPMPVLRRADAHPDAPPRPPLLATRDLGTPFLEVRAVDAKVSESVAEPEKIEAPVEPLEQPLPQDLEQPLSAFDPDAILAVPMPPPIKLPPIRRSATPPVFEPHERFEVFELTPTVRKPAPAQAAPAPEPTPPAEPIARPETEASVHALLERLEKGVVRRSQAKAATAKQAERGLEDALATLRNMARQA
ncbi:hypothetical protein IAG41_10205 [Sphingomonas sp. JC676]|uniref:hypothetical protein n=1 Tax=Sphingomonas sp. JC676 TaxID=2768065 RepID=UPI0016584017|nr:hypothetical protein [Sphingomonas sp. JC676]MBC9032763.1 hypothetical protein [Sphingomonas sp. JC676]